MIFPVILAGGSGSRLWPLSREKFPKQFLSLVGGDTMLQSTLSRLSTLNASETFVVCSEDHRFIAAEQLRQSEVRNPSIILEPAGRDTSAAIALAAIAALRKNENAVLVVMPADHVIDSPADLAVAVEAGLELANDGFLTTFGVVPTFPETGYGYIKRGAGINDNSYKIEKFVEKPSKDLAEEYLSSGDFLWNSGMFIFKASRYLEELARYQENVHSACVKAMESVRSDADFLRVDEEAFLASPAISIDYAVMEHTDSAAVIPIRAGWSDVGSWSALWDVSHKDENGVSAKGDVLTHNTSDSFIYAENSLVTTVGISDVIVVQTKDAVLVAAKDQVQEIKELVGKLKSEGREQFRFHREVYRPWGHYDSIDSGARYQVKRITVKPGEKLSVQMHHHRAEHWIVVSGTARVTIGEDTQLVTENQSVYIPVGHVHALENPGKIPLDLIEVQSGAYLGEDDIVRFEDRYGRN